MPEFFFTKTKIGEAGVVSSQLFFQRQPESITWLVCVSPTPAATTTSTSAAAATTTTTTAAATTTTAAATSATAAAAAVKIVEQLE